MVSFTAELQNIFVKRKTYEKESVAKSGKDKLS